MKHIASGMSWVKPDKPLTGEIVELRPLDETHFADLVSLSKDKRIWEFIPIDMSTTEKVLRRLQEALDEKEKGTQFPFVILSKAENRIIGSTRLMDIQPQHKKLEIGWTWLHSDYWGTKLNSECKYLLLKFCFDELSAVRVQLKTDENNLRSQKAILKTGARYEGTLRNDMTRDDGTLRNSCYYSIINSEWPDVRSKLLSTLATDIEVSIADVQKRNA
jgi:RimJ/RimL family protein N-acetyltransferase